MLQEKRYFLVIIWRLCDKFICRYGIVLKDVSALWYSSNLILYFVSINITVCYGMHSVLSILCWHAV